MKIMKFHIFWLPWLSNHRSKSLERCANAQSSNCFAPWSGRSHGAPHFNLKIAWFLDIQLGQTRVSILFGFLCDPFSLIHLALFYYYFIFFIICVDLFSSLHYLPAYFLFYLFFLHFLLSYIAFCVMSYFPTFHLFAFENYLYNYVMLCLCVF